MNKSHSMNTSNIINKSIKIAVVCGGPSAEAEVSRSSARGVVAALGENYPHVQTLELDSSLSQKLNKDSADVVFPVLHGSPGEDGTFQGFLEILGLPYVGSDVHSSSNAMDKIIAKELFSRVGLPIASQVVVRKESGIAESIEQIRQSLGSYVVVKPVSQGSGLGVGFVDNDNQLPEAIESAFKFDHRLLVEQRIDGREITVGVIDTDEGPKAFEVIEITTPEGSWYDYEHRYTEGLSEHLIPAPLPQAQTKRLQSIALSAHQVLGCRDLSRADFVVASDDEEYLLEVNTLPGMTPTSLYPDAAKVYGLDFPALVSYLVERAFQRK